jgi:hypothetical protein
MGGNCLVGVRAIDLLHDPSGQVPTTFVFSEFQQIMSTILYSAQVLGVKLEAVCLSTCTVPALNQNGDCSLAGCPLGCSNCTSTDCSHCDPSYILFNGECLSACQTTTFFNPTSRTC